MGRTSEAKQNELWGNMALWVQGVPRYQGREPSSGRRTAVGDEGISTLSTFRGSPAQQLPQTVDCLRTFLCKALVT